MLIALTAAYMLGGFSASRSLWPYPQLRAIKAYLLPAPDFPVQKSSWRGMSFDVHGRLIGQRGRKEVECPKQDARTAVFLILGQSNAANHTGQRHKSRHGKSIVGYFSGECTEAASPLLGATGWQGEYWTQTANLLVEADAFDRIVLATAAVSGSSIAQWAPGGQLHNVLEDAIRDLTAAYVPTHVLWHQGESDLELGTTEVEYRAAFQSLVRTLRELGVSAPVYVSVATNCWWTFPYSTDNPVARAQAALPDETLGIKAGINTDLLLGDTDRYDDCHFAGSGGEKAAWAWAGLLAKP